MAAKYILAALSVLFLALAAIRMGSRAPHGGVHPQVKAWLIIGAIFGVVAVYLFVQQP
jgi:DMSO reductase anchor subunit